MIHSGGGDLGVATPPSYIFCEIEQLCYLILPLMQKLEALGILDETLILCVMDHGMASGGKGTLFETGMRIAMFGR
jgi:arylsulfatase A-like enzyme